ncbi:hypothetical protein MANES_17G061000v8 [Manihot esculenta]|uniref:Uncharacterized protein n=1 Tax=Manihot esculenta TaxID=3983 RepID=A0ACB7G3Y4_MANES|nr:hypothetical protein MANES_17G061000v8 [Manihot esculenta]
MDIEIGSRRRQRKKSPAAILASIKKTICSCKSRFAEIFSKLARIRTPSSHHKGYQILMKELKDQRQGLLQENDLEKDNICRAVFFSKRLPPLISPTKRTIFLDLDETLVHSKTDPPPQKFDFMVRPNIDGEFMNLYVLKRPGVDAFLEALAEKYELVVFTAGLKEYASLVLNKLDVKGLISHRFYRDSCKQIDGKFVKDLSEMGRDLNRVVIVDDNPNCYIFQPENAVPVRPFIDDLDDGELGSWGSWLSFLMVAIVTRI